MPALFRRILTSAFRTAAPTTCKRLGPFGGAIEQLEDRWVPATITVSNTNDAVNGNTSSIAALIATPGADGISLREAIDAANNTPGADTITFGVGGMVAVGANDTAKPFAFGPTAFVITSDITLIGYASGTTIDGQDERRLFGVMAGASLTLDTLTLTGGRVVGGDGGKGQSSSAQNGGGGAAGLGGAVFNNGTLTIHACTFDGNSVQGGNGGGTNDAGISVGGGGGGVGGRGGNASLSGSFGGGGGGGVAEPGGDAPPHAQGVGGANESGSQAGPLANGTLGGGGGGGGGNGGNGFGLSSGGFGGGGGAGSGGNGGAGGFGSGGGASGDFAAGSTAGVGGFGAGGGGAEGASSGGAGGFGAGDGASGGAGGGAGLGGAVFNRNGTVIITNSTFANNSAVGGAGSGTGGAGSGLGGAIFNLNGTVGLTNTTFSGNTAAQGGQAVYSLAHETANGVTEADANVTLTNTVLAEANALAAEKRAGSSKTSSITYGGPNIVLSTTLAGGATVSGTSPSTATPLLSTLGSHGGPTQTFAPLPGSPAIDAGTSTGAPATDQRGVSRVSNVDLGAFESRGFAIAATSGSGQSVRTLAAFAAPLVATVTSAFGEPVVGGRVTFTPPVSGASATLAGSPATIGAGGAASATATANGTGGAYAVSAATVGAASAASFGLTNLATTVTSIARTTPSGPATNATVVTYTVTFAGATLGLTASDFHLTGTANIADTNIGTPTTGDGGLTWSVPVTGLGGTSGTLALNLVSDAGLDHTVTNLSFAGASYTLDHTAPTPALTTSAVAINAAGGGTSTNTVTITYNDGGSAINTATFATSNIMVR